MGHRFVGFWLHAFHFRASRKADLLNKQIKELSDKHDELADIKSAYDCEETIDSGMLGSMKLSYSYPNP